MAYFYSPQELQSIHISQDASFSSWDESWEYSEEIHGPDIISYLLSMLGSEECFLEIEYRRSGEYCFFPPAGWEEPEGWRMQAQNPRDLIKAGWDYESNSYGEPIGDPEIYHYSNGNLECIR